jgi:hypothetical protein
MNQNAYSLMMQNMMNMMMANNPMLQEMMANQMKTMMASGITPDMNANAGFKPQTTFGAALQNQQMNIPKPQPQQMPKQDQRLTSPSHSVENFIRPSHPVDQRARPQDNTDMRNTFDSKAKSGIAKKIEEMFDGGDDDLDNFYNKYSKSPPVKTQIDNHDFGAGYGRGNQDYKRESVRNTTGGIGSGPSSYAPPARQGGLANSKERDLRDHSHGHGHHVHFDPETEFYSASNSKHNGSHRRPSHTDDLRNSSEHKNSILLPVESDFIPYKRTDESYMDYSQKDLSAYLSKGGQRIGSNRNILDAEFEEDERRAGHHHHAHIGGHGHHPGEVGPGVKGRILPGPGFEDQEDIFGVKNDDYSTLGDNKGGRGGRDEYGRHQDKDDFDSHGERGRRGGNRRHNNYFVEEQEGGHSRYGNDHQDDHHSTSQDRFGTKGVEKHRVHFDAPHINTDLHDSSAIANGGNHNGGHQRKGSGKVHDPYDDHHTGGPDYHKKGAFQSHHAHDDVPIRGGKSNHHDDIPIGGPNNNSTKNPLSKPSTDDERPIRGKGLGNNSEAFTSKDPHNMSTSQYNSKPSPNNHDGKDEDLDVSQPFKEAPLNEHEKKAIKNTHKTFEQLLEEQLAAEGMDLTPLPPQKPAEPRKHNYLKKNSRTAVPAKPKVATKKGDKKEDVSKENNKSALNNSGQRSEEDPLENKEYNAEDYLKGLDDPYKPTKVTKVNSTKSPKETPADAAQPKPAAKTITYDDQEAWEKPKEDLAKKSSQAEEAEHSGDDHGGAGAGNGSKKLLETYFKSEKDKKDLKKKEEKLQTKEEEEIVRKYVQDKIDELNKEAKKLKDERDRVKIKERKLEDENKKLAKEKEEWEKYVNEEKDKINEVREEELKKIKKEKKIAERNQKAVMNMPNRKEREEIDQLKEKLKKDADEYNSKEKKLKFTIERQKKQIEELLKRNKELEEQVQLYEQMRIKGPSTTASNATTMKPNSGPDELIRNAAKSVDKSSTKLATSIVSMKKEEAPPAKPAQKSSAKTPQASQTQIKKPAAANAGKSSKFVDNEDDDHGNWSQEEDTDRGDEGDDQDDDREEAGANSRGRGSSNKDDNAGQANFRMSINPEEYAYNANLYYQEYIEMKNKGVHPKLINQTNENGKVQKVYDDGKKEIVFKNGAKREIFPNGYIIVNYKIGDVKQTLPDNSIIYYYSDADTTQITLPDNGLNVGTSLTSDLQVFEQPGRVPLPGRLEGN